MPWILQEAERQKVSVTTDVSSLGSLTADGGEIIGFVRWYDLKSGILDDAESIQFTPKLSEGLVDAPLPSLFAT